MIYDGLQSFLSNAAATLRKGPIALILIEDEEAAVETIEHHLKIGFKTLLVFANDALQLPARVEAQIERITWDMAQEASTSTIVNTVMEASAGQWVYYCYNAEFLYFPFCESRTVGELVSYISEERRSSVLAYVVDLYAADLNSHATAVDLQAPLMDRSGYYALTRKDRWNNPVDRQMDFFGGLRWRYEEHMPAKRRRIDRIALFKAKDDLKLAEDHTFNDPEYNTYACPWHHSLTASIASFRTAKALKRNPGSTFEIDTFKWHNSVPFEWKSQQLLDLGLMEPGQWF